LSNFSLSGLGLHQVSESARVTTAHEARFRAPYPNSRPRTASLIALDAGSAKLVAHAVEAAPERRRIVTLPEPVSGTDWMASLQAHTQALLDDADRSDMLVMVAQAGHNAEAASLLGEACRLRGVPVTALVIAGTETGTDLVAKTLSRLRPFATMIVVANGPDYVEDMLMALRA
jgi:hypothetical protein